MSILHHDEEVGQQRGSEELPSGRLTHVSFM
jgi:hypothetical protein